MWAAEFRQGPVVHHCYFVKVCDGVQLVSYCEDRVLRELLSDDRLDQLVRNVVNTRENISRVLPARREK